MANRRNRSTVDLVEMVRLLRAGESDRTITRVLGHNRRSIARYRDWAGAGIVGGGQRNAPARESSPRLGAATLPARPRRSSVVAGALSRGDRSLAGAGGWRWPRSAPGWKRRMAIRSATARCAAGATLSPAAPSRLRAGRGRAGEEAQVDFGYAGLTVDPDGPAAQEPGSSCWCSPGAGTSTPRSSSTSASRPGCSAIGMPSPFFGGVPARVVPGQPQGGDRAGQLYRAAWRSAPTGSAPSTMASSSTPSRRARPGSRGRSSRAASTTSDATSWPGAPPGRAPPIAPRQRGAARLV